MGFFDGLFGKISNPALIAAADKYKGDASDDNLVDLWQKFLKAKILLTTTPDGAKNFGKIKQIRDAISIPFTTTTGEKGDLMLSVFADPDCVTAAGGQVSAVPMTGEEAVILASGKGLHGMVLNPKSAGSPELKMWQHMVFVERISDANKLHALSSKLYRTGHLVDAEAVLKGAILAAQKDPGPHHPFTAELNLELARSMRGQGKLTEAEWVYKRALSIYEASGSHDVDVAATGEALGTLLVDNNKSAQAAPYFERALEIYENVPGGKPDSIGRILCQLAEIRVSENREEDAEQLYKRASILLEERKHPDLLPVINKMAGLCERQNKHKEALAHYMRGVSLIEPLKKCREIDIAHATHRAAILQVEEGHLAEAESLLDRAFEAYRREGTQNDVNDVDKLLKEIAVKKEAQEREKEAAAATNQDARPSFGRGGKRPAELPLLDIAQIKSNPKATYVPGARQEKKEENVKPPSDTEERALYDMKAFLDSVDKDPSTPATSEPPALETPEQELEVEQLVRAAIDKEVDEFKVEPMAPPAAATQEEADSKPFAEFAIASPYPRIEPEQTSSAEEPVTHGANEVEMDELFADAKKSYQSIPKVELPEASQPAQEPQSPTILESKETVEPETVFETKTSSTDSATTTEAFGQGEVVVPKETSESFTPATDEPKAKFPNIPAPPPPPKPVPRLAEPLDEISLGDDLAVAEERATAPEPPPAAVTAKEASETETDDGTKGLFDNVDLEISSVFNRSMLSKVSRDARFDTPIAKRPPSEETSADDSTADGATASGPQASDIAELVVEASQASEVAEAAEAPSESVVAADLKNLFAKPVDGEISAVFNKSVMGELAKSDRFDKPIGERLQDEPEIAESKPSSSRGFSDDDTDESGLFAPSNASKSEEQPGLFADTALDDSLTDAFKSLLSDPKSIAESRFDIPIGERMAAEKEQADKDRFDTPIGERMAAEKEQADKDRFDTPIGDRAKLDTSRFDTPIGERTTSQSSEIAPTPPQPPAEIAKGESPAVEPIAPRGQSISNQSSDDDTDESGLFSTGDSGLFKPDALDDSLSDAFSKIVAEPKSAAASRFDVPIAERKPEPNDRFDTPIGERGNDDKNRFDVPIGEQALDKDRFDKPIGERASEKTEAKSESSGLFGDELDDSLHDAFASVLADPKVLSKDDRFEKPVAERLKDAAPETTTPAPAPEVVAASAAPKPTDLQTSKAVEAELAQCKTPEELMKLLEQRLEEYPENSELWLRKGTALVQQQKLDEAIKVFDKVTTMTPNDAKAWYCKGSSLHLKTRFEDALYCFNHVLKLEQDNIKAMLRKAECLIKLGRADQSMVIYDRILLMQPKFVQGWSSKARALLQQRKLEEALSCYEQVLLIEPNNEEATKAKNLISSKLATAK